MLMFVISVFLVGALLASTTFQGALQENLLWTAFLIVFGGETALLAACAVIDTFNIVSVLEVTSETLFFILLSAVVSVFLSNVFRNSFKIGLLRRGKSFGSRSRVLTYFLSSILIFLAPVSYLAVQVPIFGWDVLDHWGPVAIDFDLASIRSIEDWRLTYSVHPSTVSILLSLFSSAKIGTEVAPVSFTPWLLGYALIILATGAHAYRVCQQSSIACIVGVVTASQPLLTNHAAIIGYAEIFIVAILTSCSVMLVSVKSNSGRFFLCILSSLLICTLKNTGFIYAAIFCLSATIAYLIPHYWRRILVLCLALMASGIFIALVSLFQEHVYLIGGREFELRLDWLKRVPNNIMHSWLLNASFIVVPLIGIALTISSWKLLAYENRGFVFVLLLFLGLAAFNVVSQLTTWGFIYARPGFDTGNSRFSLPMMVTLSLIIPYLYEFARTIPGNAVTHQKSDVSGNRIRSEAATQDHGFSSTF